VYELFIANKNYSSWSLRPWLLMRELAIPFLEHVVPLAPDSSWDLYREFSPSGKVPCLVDGDVAVWESMAIAEYLADRHPGVWPSDSRARAWARCAAAEMHAGFVELRNQCGMNCGIRVQLPELSPALRKDIARIDELWQQGLTKFGGPFLAGSEFTAVDAFFAPVAFRVQTYRLPLQPAAQQYAQRLLDLASMRSWEADALAEPWREPSHEAEAQRAGAWLEDRRKVV
jgi:glutathione S-transferase